MKFTSNINGRSIFLPTAGKRWEDSLNYAGSGGYYWSSTSAPSPSSRADYMLFNSSGNSYYYNNRCDGYTVRPVSK